MPASAKHPPSETTNPIGFRLRLEMKKQGVTSADLAKRSGVKTSFIYDIISGKSANPSTIKLARVASQLGVSLTYLAGDTDAAPAGEDYISIARLAAEPTGSIVSRHQPGEACRFSKEWITRRLEASPTEVRLLSVRGDSMEPTLYHNDDVLVDLARKVPSPPGLFVLFDGMALVVKRLEYLERPARLRVASDNPHYSTYECTPEEAIIIGRVVWFARET